MSSRLTPPSSSTRREQRTPIDVSEKRKGPTLTTIGAWSNALERTQSTSKRRHTFHADALRPMLQFLGVMTGSTSGIEHNLSSATRNLGGEQWNGSELLEERRLLLQIERQHASPLISSVLQAIRLVWRDNFGVPRVSGQGRKARAGRTRRCQEEKANIILVARRLVASAEERSCSARRRERPWAQPGGSNLGTCFRQLGHRVYEIVDRSANSGSSAAEASPCRS